MMTEPCDYRALSCEGGDQVGKADALSVLSNNLAVEGVDVITSSFPIYGTPIGNTINVLLNEGGEKFGLSSKEELEVKMSLFALNRLEFLEVFLSEDVSEDTLVLFDRSAFSNALTIAYAMKNMPEISKEDVKGLVKTALELDALLIEKLDLERCVIQLVTEGEDWKNIRGEIADLHEDSKVQEYCKYVYGQYAEVVGEGWKKIATREDGEWRTREEIFNDIYGFLTKRLGDFGKEGVGVVRDIGIREIIDNIYIGAEVDSDSLDEYVNSIRNNDKGAMYKSSVLVKECICASSGRVEFRNPEVREAISSILGRFPRTVDVLRYNLGEEFTFKLLEGV